ncbi:hypothetical protein H8E07_19835 [bacterium]|nr:hypothetical protein [bacterium]
MSNDHIRRFLYLTACLALLALTAGCSDEGTGPGGGGGDDPVSEDIGALGGEITSGDGDLTLTIPAGALDATTTITLEKLTGADVPAAMADEGVTTAYAIGPEGTVFQQPATFTYDVPAATKVGRVFDIETFIFLLAWHSETLYLIDSQQMLIDGDAGTRQVTVVVDDLTVVGILERQGLIARIEDFPENIECGQPFSVTASAGSDEGSVFAGSVSYVDRGHLIPSNNLTYSGSDLALGVLDDTHHYVESAVSSYTCSCTEDVFGTLAAAVVFSDYRLSALLFNLGSYTIYFRGVLPCDAPTGGGTSQVGVVSTTVSGGEGLMRVRPGFAGLLLALFIILLSGLNGWAAINPVTAVAVISVFLGPGAERYGVVPLSAQSAKAQGGFVDAAFEFGPNGTALTHYLPDDGGWGWSQVGGFQNNITDGVPFGNTPVSDGLVYVNNSLNVVNFLEFDPEQDLFTGTYEVLIAFEFPDLPGGLVSAYAPAADGPVLVVADGDPGRLYLHPRDGSKAATAVGDVGDGPRRVRHAGNIAVVSNYLGNSLTIAVWDGVGAATIAGTVAVGAGPIGIDVMELGDGTVGVCSTGFNDNTYTVTVIDGAGGVVSNVTTAAPGGCTGPGHAIWARDGTRNILFSCNGSDQIATVASGL